MTAVEVAGVVSSTDVEMHDIIPSAVNVWRTWLLVEHPRSRVPLLKPIAGDKRAWGPGTRARARCARHRFHRAPESGCTCGFHGVKDPSLLRRTRDPAVVGTAALWGRIVEHELGFRGELAYPQRLGLICSFCFWQRGADEVAVDHVARVGRIGLVPICGTHLAIAGATGYPVGELLQPSDVLAALLAAYAVDPIDRSLAGRLTQ